ncbi:MAG: aminopeptidase P N-terminal domain-containing protein [Gammaproteobacteria bacterium]|nr:aminopeptidase P N-terminal domain-containing protein [Gammaproteobacteria bacterium]
MHPAPPHPPFDATIHDGRRRELMRCMRGGIAIIPTAPHRPRNGDVQFPFRPDSDFYYLTHFPEPEAVAVLAPGREEGEFLLFCRERDAEREIWDGRRQGPDGAREHYRADQSFPIGELDARLPELMEDRAKVFVNMGRYADFDRKLIRWLGEVRAQRRSGAHAPEEFVDLGHTLHEMRVIKKPDEQKLMRKAAAVSAAAHRRAMRVCAPGMNECEVQAELECEFGRAGGAPAYPSIVAGGGNACILHYTDNNHALAGGDLLLIDAGAEIDCYAADITRTFPVNGKFSGEQRAVYEAVLAAQRAAVDAVRPDRALGDYHAAACETLTDALIDLGLLRGERGELLERGAYRRFYMHRTGHWLGMDVHDVGDYKIDGKWRLLEPGMVVTVEPGLYIGAAEDIDAKWHGIGVRIEDDILVTRNGNENLSEGAPKEISEIESLMAEGAVGARR